MKIILFLLILLFSSVACQQTPRNINEASSLPANFGIEMANLQTINSIIQPKLGTSSILYGNKNALELLTNPHLSIKGEKVLVLITWQQRDDPRWFGAKSLSDFMTAEVLKTEDDFSQIDKIIYQIIEEESTAEKTIKSESNIGQRIEFITSIRPAIMP